MRMQVNSPLKAQAPKLAPGVSAIDALSAFVAAARAQIQANQNGVIVGSDPEYLHQMRVAVRRLRSVCAAYKKLLPESVLLPLFADLKWLARALGPARDADVFVTEIWPPLRRALNKNPLLPKLDVQWAALQRAAAAKTRRTFVTHRYQCLMRDLGQWLAKASWRAVVSAQQPRVLDEPARDFVRTVLKRRNARVRRSGDAIQRLSDVQLHALRIRIKKLRYVVDGFGSLFEPRAVRDSLARLSHLQNVLGEINDIHVAEQHVAIALAHRRGRDVRELRAALAAWRESRTTALRDELRAVWRAYRHAGEFW